MTLNTSHITQDLVHAWTTAGTPGTPGNVGTAVHSPGLGLPHIARHVTGCNSTQEMRVQNAWLGSIAWQALDLADIARRVLARRLTQETRVHNCVSGVVDVAGTIHVCP